MKAIPISVTCRCCKETTTLMVDLLAYTEWQEGKLIQDAFPTMSIDDRELMVSRTCGKCWILIHGNEFD